MCHEDRRTEGQTDRLGKGNSRSSKYCECAKKDKADPHNYLQAKKGNTGIAPPNPNLSIGGKWSMSHPRCFIPGKEHPVPIEYGAGWASEPV